MSSTGSFQRLESIRCRQRDTPAHHSPQPYYIPSPYLSDEGVGEALIGKVVPYYESLQHDVDLRREGSWIREELRLDCCERSRVEEAWRSRMSIRLFRAVVGRDCGEAWVWYRTEKPNEQSL